jgi:prolyl 4-hydroxylase
MIGGRRARRSMSLHLPAFRRLASNQLEAVEARLSAQFFISANRLEPWQMTRYRRGDGFDYHLDCGSHAGHLTGERVRTILIVIEEPAQGGATHFRALRTNVRPRLGRLLVWNNLLPTGRCNHAMIHAGRPVWRGRKTILTTFEHELPYCE